MADRCLDTSTLPTAATVQHPRNPDHGDYASTLALQVAKRAGLPAAELARAMAGTLALDPAIQEVDVAGPGFLNIRLAAAAAGAVAGTIVAQGGAYGRGRALDGMRVNLEFVSANPTGPIHLGGARWAAVGDALSLLLRAQGAAVTTEYYFNDAGAQIDRFASSLFAAARHEEPTGDGYAGEYVRERRGTAEAAPGRSRQPGGRRARGVPVMARPAGPVASPFRGATSTDARAARSSICRP